MSKPTTDFETPKCCDKPNVCTMDYMNYSLADKYATATPRVNRVCLRCHTHWFGKPHRVRQYGSKEWDALLAADVKIESLEQVDLSNWIRLLNIEAAARHYAKGLESDDVPRDELDRAFDALKAALGIEDPVPFADASEQAA